MEPDSTKLWKVVYPIYINSKKTVAEGRRIPIEKATEHPTPKEIFEACKYLGYETEIEVDLASLVIYLFCRRIKRIHETIHKEDVFELNFM